MVKIQDDDGKNKLTLNLDEPKCNFYTKIKSLIFQEKYN